MSLRHHPMFSGGDWWDWPAPERVFDQQFGNLMIGPIVPRPVWTDPAYSGVPYWLRPSHVAPATDQPTGGVSEVKNTQEKFTINLDVSQFQPEEIEVKTVENQVQIEAKHEERMDEHGLIQRHFVRKYHLPKDVDPETITSSLTEDGVLTVQAPKKAIEGPKERAIQVQKISSK